MLQQVLINLWQGELKTGKAEEWSKTGVWIIPLVNRFQSPQTRQTLTNRLAWYLVDTKYNGFNSVMVKTVEIVKCKVLFYWNS